MKISRRLWKFLILLAMWDIGCVQFCHAQLSPQFQPSHNQKPASAQAATPQRQRTTGRFLGWKYAALAHQDTSKWLRTSASSKTPSAHTNIGLEAKPMNSPGNSATSFPYAGFGSSAKLPTGYIPTAVVQGDFNEDGKMDLAISNGGDNTIYVYIGNGDGSFAVPEVLYTTGQSPVWLAAAKLRAKGHLDLITVDGDSNQVEVFFGNGDGTFQSSTVVATLSQPPTFVLAGDFNNDGNMDLAVGLAGVDPFEPFEILQGDGNGAFPTVVLPPAGMGSNWQVTNWLAAGDINNDGLLDLVVTVPFGSAVPFLNQGGTGFTQGTDFGPANRAVAVALGDMNGDGCLDAIETDSYGYITVAQGACDGSFTQAAAAAALRDVDEAISVIDVNGDGKLDVVASSGVSGGYGEAEESEGGDGGGGYLVSVLKGDGAGNLAPAAMYRVGSQAYSLVVADLQGNGRPDIVTISQTESTASILLNDGQGGFGSSSGEAIGYLQGMVNAPYSNVSPQTVDLNGDGKPDVVLIESGVYSNLPSEITALINDGTGKFKQPVRSPITVGSDFTLPLFIAAQFRKSSPADLIYIDQETGTLAYFPGNGDGTFGAPVTLAILSAPSQMVSGDFNGDGNLDFAVLGYANSWQLDVFLGNGGGTFKHLQPQIFNASITLSPQQLIAGDFNHDGKLDLLIGNNSNDGWVTSGDDLDLALGNGDGTFQAPTTLMSHFGPVAVADLNHDGYLDLVQNRDPDDNLTQDAFNASGGAWITPAVTIYLGGPGGTFTKQATYLAPNIQSPSFFPALVGDFNGDGNVDIALPYNQSIGTMTENSLQIFQGNGDGTFATSGIPYQLPNHDLPIIGGDYRGVGVTDLLDLVGATSSINTIPAAPAPALAITPDSSPLIGNQGSATVTLALPASSSQTVQLSSSDSAVTLPGSLTFSAGEQQQTISFTLGAGFDPTHLLAITASLGGQTATAYIAQANPNLHPGVVVCLADCYNPMTSINIDAGGSLPLLFMLQSVSGYSGIFGQFQCTGLPPGASCDFAESSMQLLPGGAEQGAFELSTTSAIHQGSYNITIGASNGEISPSLPISLDVGGFMLSVNPSIFDVFAPVNAYSGSFVSVVYSDGFTGGIRLSCSGLPSGFSCSELPLLYTGSTSGQMNLSVATGVAPQDYPFQIIGTSDNTTESFTAALRVSDFSATLLSNSATFSGPSSTTFNIQLISLNHFSNSDIIFSCQSPAGVLCSTQNPNYTLRDGETVIVPLNVTYLSNTTAYRPHSSSTMRWEPALICVALLLLPSIARRNRFRRMLCILIALLLYSGISACGGGGGASSNSGGSGGSGGGGGSNSTQTVTITVSAQAQTASALLQQSVGTITLTVPQ